MLTFVWGLRLFTDFREAFEHTKHRASRKRGCDVITQMTSHISKRSCLVTTIVTNHVYVTRNKYNITGKEFECSLMIKANAVTILRNLYLCELSVLSWNCLCNYSNSGQRHGFLP